MVKQRIQLAFSGYNKKNDKRISLKGVCVFDTKEEFIAHLIRTEQIQKDTHPSPDDGLIHLKGVLKIDSRVKSGLNWNDVVVTSAVVEEGKVSRYQYLPLTYKGVTTDLKAPDLQQYMQHNNYGAVFKDDMWHVEVLRIPESATHLNFSSVKSQLTLFYGQQINLSDLPYSRNLFGLSPHRLGVDCVNARRIAQQKGCGKEILKLLPPPNSWLGFIDFGSIFGSGRR